MRLTRLNLANPDVGVDELSEEGAVERRDGMLGSAVDTA